MDIYGNHPLSQTPNAVVELDSMSRPRRARCTITTATVLLACRPRPQYLLSHIIHVDRHRRSLTDQSPTDNYTLPLMDGGHNPGISPTPGTREVQNRIYTGTLIPPAESRRQVANLPATEPPIDSHVWHVASYLFAWPCWMSLHFPAWRNRSILMSRTWGCVWSRNMKMLLLLSALALTVNTGFGKHIERVYDVL